MERKLNRSPVGRNLILAGAVALVGLLAVLVFLQNQSGSRTNEHGSINISREAYENARNTWVSHNISEYEMVLDVRSAGSAGAPCAGCGRYRLHIKDKQVTLSSDVDSTTTTQNNGSQSATPAMPQKDQTVEQMFNRIEKLLASGPERCDSAQGPVSYDYTIEFDPVLGYPTSITTARRGPDTHECPAGEIEQVDSLNVLSQDVGH